MKLIFFDIDPVLTSHLAERFVDAAHDGDEAIACLGEVAEVLNAHGPDCLVSPANSFGIMDGGIDKRIVELFPDVQATVQQFVAGAYGGQQPVGTCLTVPTGAPEGVPTRWLAHAPTMRFPMSVPASNVYDAARAVFLAVRDHPEIESVAIPGLATGTGQVPPKTAANMVRIAYDHAHRFARGARDWDQVSIILDEVQDQMVQSEYD